MSTWRAACGWVRRRYRTNSILTGIASDSHGIENGRGSPTGRLILGSTPTFVQSLDVIGEHTVHLLGTGERLELTHRATSRDLFARGALVAAKAIAGKPARRYSMADVVPPV